MGDPRWLGAGDLLGTAARHLAARLSRSEDRGAAATADPVRLGLAGGRVDRPSAAPHVDRVTARLVPPTPWNGCFVHRPDLVDPAPRDLAELAGRSTTTGSIGAALDGLNAWLRTSPRPWPRCPTPTPVADLADLLASRRPAWPARSSELRERALVWGDDEQLHLVRPVREPFEPYPGGLRRRPPRPLSATRIEARWLRAAPRRGPCSIGCSGQPTGRGTQRRSRRVRLATARTPVERAARRQLLRPLDAGKVIVPREVAWRLRAGVSPPKPVPPEPPPVVRADRGDRRAGTDRAAAGAAFGLLHDWNWWSQPSRTSRTSCCGPAGWRTRDVAALARQLGTDLAHAVFVVECVAAAGLLAAGRPTPCCRPRSTTAGRRDAAEPLAAGGGGVAGRRAAVRRSRPSRCARPRARGRVRRRRRAARRPCCSSPPAPERVPCVDLDAARRPRLAWHHPRLPATGRWTPRALVELDLAGGRPGSGWSPWARSPPSPACRCARRSRCRPSWPSCSPRRWRRSSSRPT